MQFTVHEEFKLSVEFDYQPAEPRTFDYPGCEAEVDITSVKLGDIEIIDALSDEAIKELEYQALVHCDELAFENPLRFTA